jgi:hypothetical protein
VYWRVFPRRLLPLLYWGLLLILAVGGGLAIFLLRAQQSPLVQLVEQWKKEKAVAGNAAMRNKHW